MLALCFGRFLGSKGACFITTFFLFICFLLSSIAFYDVGICGSIVSFKLGSWFSSSYLSVEWGFLFDSLTVVMLVVVTSISTLVHFYSIE
jgi:NADH-ubiquinone oxidoreductase chain 5